MSLHPTAPTEYPVDVPGVRLTRDGPHVAVLTLDHPPANALSAPVRAAVGRALDAVEADTAVRTTTAPSAPARCRPRTSSGRLAGTRDHRDAVRGVLDRRPAVFTRR